MTPPAALVEAHGAAVLEWQNFCRLVRGDDAEDADGA